MKTTLLILLAIFFGLGGTAQEKKLNIVVIGAHPDDCDLDAGGTAILYAQMGHNVMFVSLTNGDAGHFNTGGGALAKIRMAEAEEAGKRFGVKYVVLDNHDGELMPNLNVRLQVIRLIRQWNADVVIGPRPYDYHPDHRNTAIIVQDAAYLVIVPNVAPDTPPLKVNPVFLYSKDGFKKPLPFSPDIAVVITAVNDKKFYAITAHKSQVFEWLPWTSGSLDKVPKGDKERVEWVSKRYTQAVTAQERESLVKWYGNEKGDAVKTVETFEICEYGKQPDDELVRKLFPMIGK